MREGIYPSDSISGGPVSGLPAPLGGVGKVEGRLLERFLRREGKRERASQFEFF